MQHLVVLDAGDDAQRDGHRGPVGRRHRHREPSPAASRGAGGEQILRAGGEKRGVARERGVRRGRGTIVTLPSRWGLPYLDAPRVHLLEGLLQQRGQRHVDEGRGGIPEDASQGLGSSWGHVGIIVICISIVLRTLFHYHK